MPPHPHQGKILVARFRRPRVQEFAQGIVSKYSWLTKEKTPIGRHDASHFDTKTQDKLALELNKILLLRQNNASGGARFRGCRRTTLIECWNCYSGYCVKR